MLYTECPEICAQTSHIHLMNKVIKMLKTFSLPTDAHNVKKHRVIKTF